MVFDGFTIQKTSPEDDGSDLDLSLLKKYVKETTGFTVDFIFKPMNDYFEIEYLATQAGKSITSIQFTSGSFQISSYTIPKALDYDTYSERYTYS